MDEEAERATSSRASGSPRPVVAESLEIIPLQRLLDEVTAAGTRGPLSWVPAPTGFYDLDQLTGGLAKGALWAISGRSGVGKSVLVTDLIRSAAVRGGHRTLLIARSETPAQVVQRMLAAEAKIPLHHIAFGLSNAEEGRLGRAKEGLLGVPLLLVRAEVLDLPPIAAEVASRPGERPLRLLLVDDLTSFPEQLQMLAELRALAVEHRLAVVVVVRRTWATRNGSYAGSNRLPTSR